MNVIIFQGLPERADIRVGVNVLVCLTGLFRPFLIKVLVMYLKKNNQGV
jgi:hypothetical protein